MLPVTSKSSFIVYRDDDMKEKVVTKPRGKDSEARLEKMNNITNKHRQNAVQQNGLQEEPYTVTCSVHRCEFCKTKYFTLNMSGGKTTLDRVSMCNSVVVVVHNKTTRAQMAQTEIHPMSEEGVSCNLKTLCETHQGYPKTWADFQKQLDKEFVFEFANLKVDKPLIIVQYVVKNKLLNQKCGWSDAMIAMHMNAMNPMNPINGGEEPQELLEVEDNVEVGLLGEIKFLNAKVEHLRDLLRSSVDREKHYRVRLEA